MSKTKIAVVCSDIHLCHKPPLFRSTEKNWLNTQAGYLKQIKKITKNLKNYNNVPLIISGDIFDKWNVPPELISLAIRELPDNTYAVAGNHDTPYHKLEELHKSAYETLIAAKKIIDVKANETVTIDGPFPIRLHGFPYGTEIKPLENPHTLFLEIAVIHSYIWAEGKGHKNAPENKRLRVYREMLKGYDIALFGDNHIPLQWNLNKDKEGPVIFNSGGFMIRRSDEENHQPSVGIIYSDGTIEREYLDISKDSYFKEINENKKSKLKTNSFIKSISEMEDFSLSYDEIIKRKIEDEKIDNRVKDILLKSLEVNL